MERINTIERTDTKRAFRPEFMDTVDQTEISEVALHDIVAGAKNLEDLAVKLEKSGKAEAADAVKQVLREVEGNVDLGDMFDANMPFIKILPEKYGIREKVVELLNHRNLFKDSSHIVVH